MTPERKAYQHQRVTGSDPGQTVVFRGGQVFLADGGHGLATAVAIRDGRIIAVGGDRQVGALLTEADEVVELDGRMVLPGFVDAHVHPVMGGLEMSRCDLSGGRTAQRYQEIIAAYAGRYDGEWILGGGWSMPAFPGGCPTREQLDLVVADRPAILPNRDHHSAWVNTRALQLAGIDADTPDPPDGRIERDAAGRPTGTLHEGAADLVGRLVPRDTQQEYDDALREALVYLNSLGITGWQDAIVRVGGDQATVHAAYLRAQREGWLTARVSAALWWSRAPSAGSIAAQVAHLGAVRSEAQAGSDRYRAGSVKIMLDGVAETFTAAMLEPYLDRCGELTDNQGLSFFDPELLAEVAAALDAAGFQLHFHALGDRAVRDALDALQMARIRNGDSGLRHQLAHLQVVHPSDIGRFRSLGATANLQALWACHEPEMDELTIPFLGDRRSGWQYPFGDLHTAGAPLAMGSDWPVSDPNPMAAISVAVNRISAKAPSGTPPLGPEQRLPLGVALAAYTAGSARQNFRDTATGTIAVGRAADLIVLDRNPFDVPQREIAEVTVDRTYVDGELVHRKD